MSARDVIAEELEDEFGHYADERADDILSALTAAGYRLVGPERIDDVAAAMWREEAIDSGTPASVAAARTREAFDEQSDSLKDKWRKFAAVALRVLQSQEAENG